MLSEEGPQKRVLFGTDYPASGRFYAGMSGLEEQKTEQTVSPSRAQKAKPQTCDMRDISRHLPRGITLNNQLIGLL